MYQLAMNFLSGGPLQVLIELISLTISTGTKFKTKLRKLRVTLKCFEPLIIEQIRLQNIELILPVDHIEELQRRIAQGTVLVEQVSNLRPWSLHIWLNCCNCIKPDYTGQLDELHDAFKSILGRLRVRAVLQSDELVILARQTRDKEDENRREMAKIWDRLSSLLENHQEKLERNENGGNAPMPGGGGGGGGTPTQVFHLATIFLKLHEAIITLMKVKKLKLKCALEDFKFTMDCLNPLITEIAQPNSLLHLPKTEIENFIRQLEKGLELVDKCSRLSKLASYKKSDYIKGLSGLNDFCQRMFDTLRLQIEDVVIQSSVSASNLWKEIKEIEGSEVLQHHLEVLDAEPQSLTLRLDMAINQIQFGVVEPVSLAVESDAMNIYENLDPARNLDYEVEEIRRISGRINRIEFGVADPTISHTDVLHTKNMCENLDPVTRNVKEEVEEVQGNIVAQNQIEVLVVEPLSDAMNTCENLDPAIRILKEEVEEAQGSRVAQHQIEVLVAKPLSDAMNTCEKLDPVARNVEEVEEVQGNIVAQNLIEVLVAKPLSVAVNTCELARTWIAQRIAKQIEEKEKQMSHGIMRKIVLKLNLHDERVNNKANMLAFANLEGMESILVGMEDKKLMVTLTGDIDPVSLVREFMKLCRTDIVSLGPANEEEPKKEEPKKRDESKKKDSKNKSIMHYNQQYVYEQQMDRIVKLASQKAVVIFSKSSCCMSHTIKRLFYELGAIPAIYELDEESRGKEMECALMRLGCQPSVPTVFIGGKFVGSAKTIVTLHVDGSLKKLLKDAGALWP